MLPPFRPCLSPRMCLMTCSVIFIVSGARSMTRKALTGRGTNALHASCGRARCVRARKIHTKWWGFCATFDGQRPTSCETDAAKEARKAKQPPQAITGPDDFWAACDKCQKWRKLGSPWAADSFQCHLALRDKKPMSCKSPCDCDEPCECPA